MAKHPVEIERSLALHREVARRLFEAPHLVARARARVATWLEDGTVSRIYAHAWRDLLQGSAAEVARAVVEETETMDALRQVSPFAGFIDPRTRWRLLRELRSSHEAP